MVERIPGWYVDGVQESVKHLVANARKNDLTVEQMTNDLLDRSVPGYDDLTDEEHCLALATAAATAIRMLADTAPL